MSCLFMNERRGEFKINFKILFITNNFWPYDCVIVNIINRLIHNSMETTCTSGKRKKRRTRKCLDQIRKKSRRNCDDINEVPIQKLKKSNKTGDSMKLINQNRCTITTNRLTLRPVMFSKAVKSETITRPQLPSRHSSDNNKSIIIPDSPLQSSVIVNCQNSKDTVPRIPEKQRKSVAQNTEHCNEIEEVSFHDDSDSDRGNASPKSFIVFSPISQAIEPEVVSSTEGEPPPAATGYHLYSEFMDELADRVTTLAPALVQPDVLWKTRKYLQDVYTDGCRRESEQNILQCMNITGASSDSENMEPIDTIVQDPMEYIKLGMGRRSVLRERNSSEPSSPRARALCPPSRVPRSPSASPPSPPSQSSSPHLSIINDTPEYTFYPRKLNH